MPGKIIAVDGAHTIGVVRAQDVEAAFSKDLHEPDAVLFAWTMSSAIMRGGKPDQVRRGVALYETVPDGWFVCVAPRMVKNAEDLRDSLEKGCAWFVVPGKWDDVIGIEAARKMLGLPQACLGDYCVAGDAGENLLCDTCRPKHAQDDARYAKEVFRYGN